MKSKLLHFFARTCLVVLLLPPLSYAQSELFISEYIEGTSNNKAIEIYNGTGAAIDLAAGGYAIRMYFNGNASPGLTINLSGVVANGDVFVLAQSSADPAILAQADQTNGAGWFNGDDAVVLFKGTNVIDAIGQVGFDPGSEWGSGLVSTQDNTLRRKANIIAGDTNPNDAFDPSIEWDGFAVNTFDGLGSHTVNPGGGVATFVIINEIDSDTPGTDNLEFVELYDGGLGNTSLNGLVVVFYNGATDASYAAFDLDGYSTDASGYFLMGNSAVTPTPSLIFSNGLLQNGADAVALYVGNAADFPNGTAVTTTSLLDAIVYDTDDADDAGLLVLLNPGQPQVNEAGGGDKDNHSNQRIPNGSGGARNTDTYVQLAPTPGAENTGTPPPVTAEIFEIQGSGLASPFAGQVVTTEENVVTALAPNGFFMQTPAARDDGDPTTSNGIFVFTGGAPAVAVGDLVNVTGEVIEFFEFTEFSNGPSVSVVGTASLPAPVTFNALTPSPDPNTPSGGANNFEAFEGMLIKIEGGTITASNQRFNPDPIAEVFIVAASARAFREPGIQFPGLPGLPVWDGNPEVFELDPDKLGLPNQIIPAGSSFDAVGVLGYEFGGYEFWPSSLTVTPAPLPVAVRNKQADEATIGSLNLFRLFDDVDDPPSVDAQGNTRNDEVVSAAEYARRRAKLADYILNVLRAPDILAVQEAEKLEVLQALAADIAALDAGVVYTAYLVEGNDVGTIDIGFMVRSSVSVDAITQLGKTETFIDPTDGSTDLVHDRPPLLLEGSFITASGPSPIAVIGVHMRSFGSIDDPVSGPRVRQKRLSQAQSIAATVQALQMADPSVRLAVVGDFNDYEFSDGYVDVIGQIKGDFVPADNLLSGPDLVDPNLTNQVDHLPAGERYSFIFSGSAQVLDHALTSSTLNPAVTGFAYGRGNADAAVDLINDASTPLRASDHDGLVLFIDVTAPQIVVSADPARLWPPNHNYHTFSVADFVTSISDGIDDGLSISDVYIVSVSSDEPEDSPGDGNTLNDILIVDCQTVDLRAERAGNGNGRVYTINAAAQDAAGNTGIASFQVHVPQNKNSSAIDDGVAYEVESNCSAPSAAKTLLANREDRVSLEAEIPSQFSLEQNYPNPFNPETMIRFQLPEASEVELVVFDLLGREIRTLLQTTYQAGFHVVRWDGRDDYGNPLPSGIYLYRIKAGSYQAVKKLNLLR